MAGTDERRRTDEEWRTEVRTRLDEHDLLLARGRERMRELSDAIAGNTAITERIDANTQELLGIFGAMRGAVKVGSWFGKAVVYIATIVVSVGILYWAVKNGVLPKGD